MNETAERKQQSSSGSSSEIFSLIASTCVEHLRKELMLFNDTTLHGLQSIVGWCCYLMCASVLLE